MKDESYRRVLYLSPPKKPRRRRNEPKVPAVLWLRTHRNEVAPWVAAWIVALAATAAHAAPLAPLWCLLAGAGVSAALYRWGVRIRSLRQFTAPPKRGKRSRLQTIRLAYILAMPGVGAVWAAWATWGEDPPGLREWGVLFLTTPLAATYWWLTLRKGASVKVEMIGLSSNDEHIALRDARVLIRDWIAYTSAAKLEGAELRGITFTRSSVQIHMRIRRGQTLRNFNEIRREKLATASLWPVGMDAVRIDRNIGGDARRVTVRYMLDNPLEDLITVPAFEDMDDQNIEIGVFEDGGKVYFEWINTLIAGITRAGKSGILNTLIRAFAKMPHVAIIGVDVKPGAPELSPWKDVMAALGNEPGRTRDLLTQVKEGLTRRGEIMAERGWRVWDPTPEEPFIVVIIDEIQLLDRVCKQLVADIASVIAAFGGIIIVATQYPIKENLPPKIRQNLDQTIGLRTANGTADQVIFGSEAKQTGWTPSILCRKDLRGTFLIRNGIHTEPMLARGCWLTDADIQADVKVLRNNRTMVDAATWVPLGGHETAGELERHGTVVDVEVLDTPEDRVLEAISMGNVFPAQIAKYTGIPTRTVNVILARLKAEGVIVQDETKKRGPYRKA